MSESTEVKTENNAEKEVLTRRGFIGVGSAALAAAGILTASGASGQEQGNQKQDRSKSDPGPKNTPLHAADEWAFVLYGTARITAIDKDGKSFVADVKKNDVWYFPSGITHSSQGLDPDG